MAGAAEMEADERLPPPVHLLVRLQLPDKPEREYSYDFRQHVISLGRDPGNDIQIPLTTVSRRHARIFYEVGDYFLEDLGSTHGTDHNGKKLQKGEKRLLRDGDTISVMSFSIAFKTTPAALLDRQPGEKTEALARRMVQEVLSSLGSSKVDPPALRIMNGVDEGRRFELREELAEVTLGRSPDCDVPLNDQNVSRRHCLIKRSWHGFTAQDLGSKNGVVRNGKRIEGVQMLKDGDELQIGGVKLVFIDPPSRILEQMGGLAGDTIDPLGKEGTPPAPSDEEGGEAESDDGPSSEAPSRPGQRPGPGANSSPDVEVEPAPPMSVEASASASHEGAAASQEGLAAIQSATKSGGHWDVIILVFGGIFLLAAIGLIVLLVM